MDFIYGSQTPEQEAAMVKAVKDHKAGFVVSDSTLTPEMTMQEVMDLKDILLGSKATSRFGLGLIPIIA